MVYCRRTCLAARFEGGTGPFQSFRGESRKHGAVRRNTLRCGETTSKTVLHGDTPTMEDAQLLRYRQFTLAGAWAALFVSLATLIIGGILKVRPAASLRSSQPRIRCEWNAHYCVGIVADADMKQPFLRGAGRRRLWGQRTAIFAPYNPYSDDSNRLRRNRVSAALFLHAPTL